MHARQALERRQSSCDDCEAVSTAADAVVGAYSVIKKKSLFKTYLIGLSFILPTVTRLIFTTFPCVEVDTGESWLVADKRISCDDEGERQTAQNERRASTSTALF